MEGVMKKVLYLFICSFLILTACSNHNDSSKDNHKKNTESTSHHKKTHKQSKDKNKTIKNEKDSAKKKNTLNQLDSNDNSDRVSGEKVQQNIKNNPANNKQNTEQQSYNQSIGYTQSSNNEKHQQTSQEQNGNIKFPMNSEIPNQYITGDVAKALDKKTKIEQQASKDNEKGIISDAESIRRQKEASQIFNNAIEQ